METLVNTIFEQQFNFTYGSIVLNTEDITDEESLTFPTGNANCMNWIVGHIIDARNQLLVVLKRQPVWNNKELHYYARGSTPKKTHQLFLPFGELIELLKTSHERLIAGIKNIPSNQLDAISILTLPDGTTISHTPLEWMTVFSFHESYHCGQTGFLRTVLGKEGKIK